LTLLEDESALQKPSEAPLDTKNKGRRDCRTLHGELLEARLGCDFTILATLACPAVVYETTGVAQLVAKMACEDALVIGLYRNATLNVHAELEALGKWFPPRNYPLPRRDVKLAKLAKEWSKAAVLNCGLKHRERRAYLIGELDVCRGLLVAVPGVGAPKAPLVLACCALARDEVLWALRHDPARGGAALPPKHRMKHYDEANFEASDLPQLADAFTALAALIRRDRRKVASYYVAYAQGADAEALTTFASKAASQAPTNCGALITALADRVKALTVEEALKTAIRAERDGRFSGGELNAEAVAASPVLTLKLDWRRAHAKLCASAVSGDVATFCRWMHVTLDHLSIADGTLILEHCDAGALWPFRNQLLRRLDASLTPEGPSRLVRALLETSRYARRCLGHGACDDDAIQLETESKALAELTLNRFAAVVQGCLAAITTSLGSLAAQLAPVEATYRQERRKAALKDAARRGLEEPAEAPLAGYESMPKNERAIAPLVHAETRLASLLNVARWDFSDREDARGVFGGPLVVGDVRLRPLEYAKKAVTAFLDREIPNAFFTDDALTRPTSAERTYTSIMGACARAAGYFDVDYCGHVFDMLGGPPGWQQTNPPPAAERARGEPIGSVLAERVADCYVRIIRSLPPHVVYCPQHRAWRSTLNNDTKKKGEAASEPSLAEKVLQGPELEALVRVLGADGARCLDAALTRAAVDEMARCKTALAAKPLRPAFERVHKGSLTGDWVPAAQELKTNGVLDALLAACVRLGNILALRTIARESHARVSRLACPHMLDAALLALDAHGASASCAAAPSWLIPPPKKFYDPTYHPPVDDDAFDSPLYRALTADTPFGAEHYERDGNLHREASAVVESSDDFKYAPWALAAAMSADAWKPARWYPDLAALSPGLHVISFALKALAHVSSGALDDPLAPKRAQQMVADFVSSASSIVTHMRLHEKAPDFVDLPLRAQYMVIESVCVDANLPRSYLERHLPYAAIHAALMDIAMGHQTAADDLKQAFTPEVFDP